MNKSKDNTEKSDTKPARTDNTVYCHLCNTRVLAWDMCEDTDHCSFYPHDN